MFIFILFIKLDPIHALNRGRCLPCVYTFLPRKTEEIYVKFLSALAPVLREQPLSVFSYLELGLLFFIFLELGTVI